MTDDLIEKLRAMDARADEATADENDDAYHMGVRDGFEDAVQTIDMMTGGDGEYRFCTNGDPDRHCPDPAAMIAKITARIATQQEAIDELFAGLREAHDQLWHLAKDPATNPWLIDTAALLSKHGERT